MITILQALLGLAAFAIIYPLYGLYQGRKIAKAAGLPYVYVALHEWNPILLVAGHQLKAVLRKVGLERLIRYSAPSWIWGVKYEVHRKLGDVFCVISPGGVAFHVADAELASDILKKRAMFPRPVKSLVRVLAYFGPNISSTEHDEWRFHRRVTTKTFTEEQNRMVWRESLLQAEGMLNDWAAPVEKSTSHADGVIFDIGKDCRKLALNIVSRASFGIIMPWKEDTTLKEGYTMSFGDAANMFLGNLSLMAHCPRWMYKYGPKICRDCAEAGVNIAKYTNALIDDENKNIAEGNPSGTLLSTLLSTDDPEAVKNAKDGYGLVTSEGIRKDFVVGNTLIFMLAGHETSARSIEFAFILLAMNPDIQQEILDEIDEVCAGVTNIQDVKYEDMFNKLTKTSSILNEAVRLFTIGTYLPRSTEDIYDGQFSYQGRRIDIPPETMISLNAVALHYSPKNWSEPAEFRPSRWYSKKGDLEKAGSGASTPDIAATKSHRKGTFLGFGEGPRACPGKRFAQIEAAAVFLTVFREHRLELVKELGETDQETYDRAFAALQRSRIVVMLNLQDQIKVKLVKRK